MPPVVPMSSVSLYHLLTWSLNEEKKKGRKKHAKEGTGEENGEMKIRRKTERSAEIKAAK